MHVRRGRQKPVALVRRLVAQVFRVQVKGLLEVLVGLLIVLSRLGVGALGIEILGSIAAQFPAVLRQSTKSMNRAGRFSRFIELSS